jgi:N-acetylglucosamine kinase-like BadF-type ATPase
MPVDFFLGIDGGGTKTIALVIDSRGNIIDHQSGYDTNYCATGIQESREKLLDIVNKIKRNTDLNRIKSVVIGNSAINYSVEQSITRELTRGIIDCDVTMVSDAYAALIGHTQGKSGCLIISGTGSISIAMDKEKNVKILGGWGHILGDDGSAYDIAMKGYRSAVRYFDGIDKHTLLADKLIDLYSLKDPYDLGKIILPSTTRSKIAEFSKVVKECAENGDKVSIGILKNAAKYLAKLGEKAAAFSHCNTIGIYGSVLLWDKIVRDEFISQFKTLVKDGKAVEPILPAEAGAALLAMERCNIKITDSLLSKIKKSIDSIKDFACNK